MPWKIQSVDTNGLVSQVKECVIEKLHDEQACSQKMSTKKAINFEVTSYLFMDNLQTHTHIH